MRTIRNKAFGIAKRISVIVQTSPDLFALLMKLDGPLANSTDKLKAEYAGCRLQQEHPDMTYQTLANPANDRTALKL